MIVDDEVHPHSSSLRSLHLSEATEHFSAVGRAINVGIVSWYLMGRLAIGSSVVKHLLIIGSQDQIDHQCMTEFCPAARPSAVVRSAQVLCMCAVHHHWVSQHQSAVYGRVQGHRDCHGCLPAQALCRQRQGELPQGPGECTTTLHAHLKPQMCMCLYG